MECGIQSMSKMTNYILHLEDSGAICYDDESRRYFQTGRCADTQAARKGELGEGNNRNDTDYAAGQELLRADRFQEEAKKESTCYQGSSQKTRREIPNQKLSGANVEGVGFGGRLPAKQENSRRVEGL
tara:strand:+ start:387 stop:770 length:384 start_codon:yes stop_codon:yes gene_type:complete